MNFENRSIFGEAMDKSIVSRFYDSRCIYIYIYASKQAYIGTAQFETSVL